MLTIKQQDSIIRAAVSAPSADNSQPFLFNWKNEKTLNLWIDETRSGKVSDNRFILSDIALGAVIESIAVKAGSLAFNVEVFYFPNTSDDEYYIAQLVFSAAKLKDKILADNLPLRCTDRRFPFKGKLSEASQEKITLAAQQCQADIQWYTERKSINAILPVILQAETLRFKSEMLHQELFSTINFISPKTPEGMHLSVLAIEAPARPLFKLMSKWPAMKVLNSLGAASLLGFRSVRIPITFSPALALITIHNDTREEVIKGGRALQRTWLTATELGLSVQPYAAPGIFSLGFINCENYIKTEMGKVKKTLSSQVTQGLGLIFLRLGYNKPVKAKTQRRKISSFIKKL